MPFSPVKPLQELTDAQRQRKNLVDLAQPEDERMFDVLEPLFEELIARNASEDDQVNSIQALLQSIPTSPFKDIVETLAKDRRYTTAKYNPQETVITFQLGSLSEEYWLHLSPEGRAAARHAASSENINGSPFKANLELVKANWQDVWNTKRYPDYFRTYLLDQKAGVNVWESKRTSVSSSIETVESPSPTSSISPNCSWASTPQTHVVNRNIWTVHPGLDPSEATVDTLPNAKMAVAHYGCWAATGDPHGRRLSRTRDSTFIRSWGYQEYPRQLFPKFCRSDCLEILKSVDDNIKITTDEEDFLSLFALGVNGHTQRHKDRNDIAGVLAGLCTLGRYTGGHLCLPQLGIKVPYQLGACALIRGTAINDLVQDYSGLRFFLIGTNHESIKRHAFRKMGRLPPLPPRGSGGDTPDEDDEALMETTCVNMGDDRGDDIEYTNKEVHGPAVLWQESSSEASAMS
ncbi:hypothetical protein NKR23_g5000 [Pleurostoma richardsiae]|uniref:Uncharacterized protein n=1 Tax=Pleurostoma richardsiae TaxID=41990 RepID=A0AA38RUI1_9PEZI|nr:hypothetical protein NKR23_g5000 [Pleurostoma richardsiae]